jgi:hypothetical protein
VGTYYDIAVRTTDQSGNILSWVQFLNHGEGITYEEKWQSLIDQGYVKRFLVADHIAPVAHGVSVTTDCTPDSSVVYVHGDVYLETEVDDYDVTAVTWAFLEVGSDGPWTVIERVEREYEGEPVVLEPVGGSWGPVEGYWNTELLNGTYWIGAFAEDYYGNVDGDLTAGLEGAPTNPLQVNVDNQGAHAWFVNIYRADDESHTYATELERGQDYVFSIEAEDNFTVRKVRFYYRHTNGDPDNWTQVGGDRTWPYSFTWTIPTDFVVGWNYDFAAVAVDYCEQTDRYDDQGNYIVDETLPIVDEEANISIFSFCGENPETTPHLSGDDICIVAHS